MAPSAGTFVASENEELEVLHHNRAMNETLDDLLADIENEDFDNLKRRISALRNNFSGVANYLSSTIEPKFYAKHRLEDSTIAVKVFAVPELLETVLGNLMVDDLMDCYGVSRTFRDVIERSTKLQIKLFLQPAPKDSPVRCSINHKNFKRGSGDFLDFLALREGEINVTMRPIPGSTTTLTTIGSRWKAMLIGQPPIHRMSYNIDCYPEGIRTAFLNGGLSANHPHRPKKFVESEAGLTVGDLYEAGRMLLEQHSACPRQTSRQVSFTGPV